MTAAQPSAGSTHSSGSGKGSKDAATAGVRQQHHKRDSDGEGIEESDMPHRPSGGGFWGAAQRWQVLLTAWGVVAISIAVLLLRQLDGEATGLFYLYYQPLIPMAAMLWAWAASIDLFEARAIRYDVCFAPQDQHKLLPPVALYELAALVSAVIASSAAIFAWLCWQRQLELAAYQPPVVYGALAALLFIPFDVAYKETRSFFSSTLARVATPFREVTWADFLLADFLTSLAKPISDGERALCHLLTGPVMDPSPKACSGASWLVPAAWALPFAWRFCQCLRVWADTGATPQLWNALKYSTAFPVIALSAAKASVSPADWQGFYRPLWIAACALNSGYSYFWDVERDWEVSWFTNSRGERGWCGLPRPALRDHLFFGRPLYLYLLASNAAMRLAWLHKLVPALRRSHAAVLGFALLEVFRRTQWAPVRIEVELRKLQAAKPELGRLVPVAAPSGYEMVSRQARLDAGSRKALPPLRTSNGESSRFEDWDRVPRPISP